MKGFECGGCAYRGVDDMLVARIVVDVDGHAAQGRHLAGELVEPRVVLSVVRDVVLAAGYPVGSFLSLCPSLIAGVACAGGWP